MNAKAAMSEPAGRQPRNGVESQLVELISDVLMTDSITIDDDFFDLGGRSIAAVQLSVKSREPSMSAFRWSVVRKANRRAPGCGH
jgi:hypothetical protein